MELVTLHNSTPAPPTTAKSDNKVYKRYLVSSTEDAVARRLPEEEELEQPAVEEKKMEFFYIGKNLKKIDSIIKAFDRGYYAESVDKAVSIIKRIARKDAAPEIIIVDGLLGEAALKELNNLLSGNEHFSKVPV